MRAAMVNEPPPGSFKLGAFWPTRSAEEELSDAAAREEADPAPQLAALQAAIDAIADVTEEAAAPRPSPKVAQKPSRGQLRL